ncbi:MAG: hypothetical protein JKY12_06685, partial [Sneathiella sp.]|nr:hypothetical protein [Sneathiella sp.]
MSSIDGNTVVQISETNEGTRGIEKSVHIAQQSIEGLREVTNKLSENRLAATQSAE